MSRHLGWLLRSKFVQGRLRRRVLAGPPGPTEAERRANRRQFLGEVVYGGGPRAVARQTTPDGYDLTIQSSLAAVGRLLNAPVSAGYHTPAKAFGPDFALELPGVSRTDEPSS